jgi:hypothetical protein
MQGIKPRVLVAALAITTAFFAAVGVSPAGAEGHDHAAASGCSWDAHGDVFGSLGGLTATVAARGGDELREPNLGQVVREAPRRGARPGTGTTIPTYVHVVTPDGVTGNVPDRKIREQITVLDLTFAGFYGGVATGFDFELAGTTRTVNATWFTAGPGTAAEHEMKQALRQGGDNALNLYLTTAAGFLGWAYLPSVLDTSQAYLDGVVIDWETLPKVSDTYAGRFDLGYTATHEAGHWLNLLHTFDGGCGATGDLVDDTPAQGKPTSGCPEGKDTCRGKPGLDPIHNYMDYSDDPCYTEFSAGQTTRMQDAWAFWRAA